MSIAVIADIHGNLLALEAVIADALGQGARHFLIAGDLVSRAPYPAQVMRRIQNLDAHIIRGNAEQYQLDYMHAHGRERFSQAAWGLVGWTHALIGEAGVAYLAALPEVSRVELPGLPPIRMLHGSPASPNIGLVPYHNRAALKVFRRGALVPEDWPPIPLDKQLAGTPETLLICGHTHIPWQEQAGHTLVLNPGSVGLPINGDRRAQYALLDWRSGAWRIRPRAVGYDWAVLKAAYRHSGLLEAGGPFARACMVTALSGENVSGFLLQFARSLNHSGDLDASLDEAALKFNWAKYENQE